MCVSTAIINSARAEFPESDLAAIFVWTQGREHLLCGLESKDGIVMETQTLPTHAGILASNHTILWNLDSQPTAIGEFTLFLDQHAAEARLMKAMLLQLAKIIMMI